MCIYTYSKACKLLNDSHKYFTFGSHICSFTSMTNLVISCLADIFVLPMSMTFYVRFTNIFTFGNNIYSFITMTTSIFLVWRSFLLIYVKKLLKLYTWVSIHNANDNEVLSDSRKYFTFASHICSFTYTYVTHTNVTDIHIVTCIHRCLCVYVYRIILPSRSFNLI